MLVCVLISTIGDIKSAMSLMREGMHKLKEKNTEDINRAKIREEHTTQADVIQFAGCKDHQVISLPFFALVAKTLENRLLRM